MCNSILSRAGRKPVVLPQSNVKYAIQNRISLLLKQEPDQKLSYPFPSLEDGLAAIFLEGSTARWHEKLALFLYTLLDAGHKNSAAALGYSPLECGVTNLEEGQQDGELELSVI